MKITGKSMMKFPIGWKDEGNKGSKVNNQKKEKNPSLFNPELIGGPSFPIIIFFTIDDA
jgi:hypothetical protein